ncbi:MAG: type II secretion system protein [Tepidisphaeraceae bacterium]|jgi:prepilin-type N-terminal cleavage/methylation domain-containing protein
MIDPRIHRRTAGFTLLELMISIALVLILLVGVNYVFRTAVDSIGAGEQIIQFTQDSRTASRELLSDFNNIAPDPPCFIIASQIVPQFLNANDAQNETDPRYFLDTSTNTAYIYGTQIGGMPPGGSTVSISGQTYTVVYIPAAVPNNRDHRCDMVRFFVHGLFPRRTGNDGTFISTTTSSAQDAFVTIGHAMLPTVDASVFVGPTTDGVGNSTLVLNPILGHLVQQGAYPPLYGTSPVYQESGVTATQRLGGYASDWVLARNVALLRDPNSIANNPPNNYDVYYSRQNAGSVGVPPWYGVNMTPLGNDSPDSTYNPPTNTNSTVYQSSRYDLVGRTMEQIRRDIADAYLTESYANNNNAQPVSGDLTHPYHLWWNPLVYNLGAYSTVGGSGVPMAYTFGTYSGGQFNAASVATPLINPDLTRMNANPQIPTPLSAQGVALMAPYFLQHVSQFIVEYAGDYLQQDSNVFLPNSTNLNPHYGAITGLGSDGQIDFVTDQYGNRRIRWYGMPRSTSGVPVNQPLKNDVGNFQDGGTLIRGFNPGVDTLSALTFQQFIDVIPLRDYYWLWYMNNGVTAAQIVANPAAYTPPWEVDVNFDPTKDYGNPTAWSSGLNNAFQVNYATGQQTNARYACAWYNDMPAMIRILIKVDDPNNKVKDGPWYEYVFKLK